jgi:hypothetical protein
MAHRVGKRQNGAPIFPLESSSNQGLALTKTSLPQKQNTRNFISEIGERQFAAHFCWLNAKRDAKTRL